MKKCFFIVLFAMIYAALLAQDIDRERMNRDIEVAKNVLLTLMSSEDRANPFFLKGFRNESVDAVFLEDYGIIFTVDLSMHQFGEGGLIALGEDDGEEPDQGSGLVIASSDYNKNKEKAALRFMDKARTFLVDYGSLLGQLDVDHHIMIKWSDASGPLYLYAREIVIKGNDQSYIFKPKDAKIITAEIGVKDVKDIQAGKLSRDEAFALVMINEINEADEKIADLEILSSMFERLYEQDLSETYYSSSDITYQKLDGVGAVFKMRVYSSVENAGLFTLPTIDYSAKSEKERNEKVMSLLPDFEKTFKENLVNYGRTVKSVPADKVILFEVAMTQCKECPGFPTSMKFSIKMDVLNQYNQGKIDLQEAMAAVRVEKRT